MSTSEVGECTATPEYLRLEGEFWRTVGAAAVVVLPPCVQSEEDLCHSAKRCARQVCAGIRHSCPPLGPREGGTARPADPAGARSEQNVVHPIGCALEQAPTSATTAGPPSDLLHLAVAALEGPGAVHELTTSLL